MGFRSFIEKLLKSDVKKVDVSDNLFFDDIDRRLTIQAYALQVVVEIFAMLLSKCEIKTYRNGKAIKGEEWYLFNVKPNSNQNAAQFKSELVRKTLIQGKSLIVQSANQLIIADDWNTQEYTLYPCVFSQVAKDGFTFSRSWVMDDVIYLTYSNGRVKSIIGNMLAEYDIFLQSALDNYQKAGGQKGTLEIPSQAQGAKDFEQKFNDLMNTYFKKYFKSKNAVVPLWGGMKYSPQNNGEAKKTVSETTDYISMFNDALKKTAIAYNIAPPIVSGNAEGLSEAMDMTLTLAIDPFAKMLSQEITAKRYTKNEVLRGCYAKVCTDNVKHFDILGMATAIDKILASGLYSTNELRDKIGEEKIPEPWADKHIRTKNYETVTNAGGENDE